MTTATLNKLLVRVSLYEDTTAYKELFLHYYKRLVSFSALITKNHGFAEEVVSDVFLKIWNNRATLSSIDNFHLYIYVITRNMSINRFLKEKRNHAFTLDSLTESFVEEMSSPEDLMITSEMKTNITAAINELPPRCRLIFKLIREDGLKHKEVAELLELSVKTVENQMTIALKKIASALHIGLTRTLN